MIDTIFSCPIRKYNINDSDITDWAYLIYNREFENVPSPFKKILDDKEIGGILEDTYTETIETFVKDIGLGKTHVALIKGAILCVLEKGESLSLCNTLPSHYTFTHYIEGNSPDAFYHPARQLLEVFNPGLDEWSSAVSLYTNEGDVIVHPSYLDYLTPPVDNRRITFTTLVELALK
jgi:hypothetical protein